MDNFTLTPPPSPQFQPPAPVQPAPQPKPMRISIILPTNAYFVSGIRDFTLGLIRNMTEFSEQWAFRFQSVVDELCNNAIEHGSSPDQDIRITFINYPHDSIEIIVEDSGTGKVKVSAADLQRIVNERRDPAYIHMGLRGRGLSKIVAEWTDELEFKDISNGGLQVRIKKYLKDPKLEMEMSGMTQGIARVMLN
jgi:anti-sigma regulatory factor (Ser/Thr protein kinase)